MRETLLAPQISQGITRKVLLLSRCTAVLGAVLALLFLSGARPAHGQIVIFVNSKADDNSTNGNCTLREAIIAANTNTDVDQCAGAGGGLDDVIEFDLPSDDIDHPNGAPRISIGDTPLPDITERVWMRGNVGNPQGPTRVEIHGPGGALVSGHHGLTIARDAGGTEIDGMVINNSADDGILIAADEVTLYLDLIGTDAEGVNPMGEPGIRRAGAGQRRPHRQQRHERTAPTAAGWCPETSRRTSCWTRDRPAQRSWGCTSARPSPARPRSPALT